MKLQMELVKRGVIASLYDDTMNYFTTMNIDIDHDKENSYESTQKKVCEALGISIKDIQKERE